VRQLLKMHHDHFSVRSRLLVVLFMIVFVIAVVVDFAAMLQYVGLVNGLPLTILEIGASITAVTIFPLIVMGMSISGDLSHPK
jgi:hypothetical protein